MHYILKGSVYHVFVPILATYETLLGIQSSDWTYAYIFLFLVLHHIINNRIFKCQILKFKRKKSVGKNHAPVSFSLRKANLLHRQFVTLLHSTKKRIYADLIQKYKFHQQLDKANWHRNPKNKKARLIKQRSLESYVERFQIFKQQCG